METRWLYTTSENFNALREASCDTCIIPIGCVEKHSIHLPLGQDIIQISHLAYMASQLETVCVFPDFAFGDVPENYPGFFPGSIMLPLETEMLLLEQLCEQIARNGFKKIIFYNGHGGNSPWLSAFLRKLDNKPHDYVPMVMMVHLSAPHKMAEKLLADGSGSIPELTKEDEELILKYHEEGMKIGHAGFGETSYMLGIAPEAVKMDRLGVENGLSRNLTKKYSDVGILIKDGGWGIDYPDAYSGHTPYGCNERIGKAALRMEAERAAKAIKVIKEDEDLIKWHNKAWKTDRL